jgi:capsular polysaccharide biosynthesis protein
MPSPAARAPDVAPARPLGRPKEEPNRATRPDRHGYCPDLVACLAGPRDAPERPDDRGEDRDVQEASLSKILAVLRARWLLILLLATPVLLVSAWYAATRPPAYSSQVVLTFTPKPAASPDISFVRLLPRYVTAATAQDALQAVSAVAGVPEAALRDSVTAVNPPGTVDLTVTAITDSPRVSQSVATQLADRVITATRGDPLVGARVIVGATEPDNGTPLRQLAAVGAGLVLCLLPGISLAFALEGARPRIRVREDLVGLGVEVPAVVRRRALSKRRLPWRRRRDVSDLAGLALDVRGATRAGGAAPLVLASPGRSGADLLARLTSAVSQASGVPAAGAAHVGTAPTLVASPGLLTDEIAREAVRGSLGCLLVLPAGTLVERAQECVGLVERLGARLIGAVLLR